MNKTLQYASPSLPITLVRILILLALVVSVANVHTPWSEGASVSAASSGARVLRLGDDIGFVGKSYEGTYGISWGDWDNDGDLDLAVANYFNDEKDRVYENVNGTLICDPSQGYGWEAPVNYVTFGVAWADYDGDGDLDLALANNGTPVLVYENEGGTLQFNPGAGLGWQAPVGQPTRRVVWADWDNDGDLDMLVVNQGSTYTPVKSRIYENLGGGSFGFDPGTGVGWEAPEVRYSYNAAWADYDKDGDLDLAFASAGNVLEVFENSGGTLQLNPGTGLGWVSTLVMNTLDVAWGDYNNDGWLDIAVGNYPDFYNPNHQYLQVYSNNHNGTFTLAWQSTTEMATTSIAWGDWDNDGWVELAVGNTGQPNRVYENTAGTLQYNVSSGTGWQSTGYIGTTQVAWADWDGDGDLDLTAGSTDLNLIYTNHSSNLVDGWSDPAYHYTQSIAWGDMNNDGWPDLAAINYNSPNVVYLNDHGTLELDPGSGIGWASSDSWSAYAGAWGDYNNDGWLDLAITNSIGATRVYENVGGTLQYNPGSGVGWVSPNLDDCGTTVAWGDTDNDGNLELIVGGPIYVRVYDNTGSNLVLNPAAGMGWQSDINLGVYNLAPGDYDNDGDLDIATSGVGRAVSIFENLNGNFINDPANGYGWTAPNEYFSYSVAWGDYDGDGQLDLAVGNFNYHAQVYRNTGTGMELAWESGAIMPTRSVAWGDWDGDGDLDLAAGNPGEASRVFENVGGELMFDPTRGLGQYFADGQDTYGVAWGDVDRDGDLDLAYGVDGNRNGVLINDLRGGINLPNNPPTISVRAPGVMAGGYPSAQVFDQSDASLAFRLADPEGDTVRLIKGYYSIDGGGTWSEAVPLTGSDVTDLAAPAGGASYTFNWDPVASGLMGQADNVLVRLVAFPGYQSQSGYLPDQHLWPSSSGTSTPFRARGIQIRVMDGTTPVQGAVVYRLAAGIVPGLAFADSRGNAYTTDGSGYLQGRGQLNSGDELVALAPVSTNGSATLYHTNGIPNSQGLAGTTTYAQGVQVLDVSGGYPLELFDLTVSLEWDASYDAAFLEQLQYNLGKVSSYLYDFTNGQVALGHVTVYQNRDHWDSAHIRVMASNRLRPWSVIGGVVDGDTPAPFNPDLVYSPGAVTIGSVWNRYGTPGQIIGDDWPLILAHELSHYLLFLDDVYLGLDSSGNLETLSSCTGSAMGDLYSDPNNTELIFDDAFWTAECSETLANITNGRDEWDVITAWYDQLILPTVVNPGPYSMTYAFTDIEIRDPSVLTSALLDPTFYIVLANGKQTSTNARAYLEKSDGRQVRLGAPVGGQNRVIALGAEYGDRLCVFDPGYYEFGCETISPGDNQLNLVEDTTWNPIVSLMPESILTPEPRVDLMHVSVAVTGFHDPAGIYVRLFPEYGDPYDAELMTSSDGVNFSDTITLREASASGLLQIYVDEGGVRRETILPYSVGGNPGYFEGGTGSGWQRSGNAPLLSPDGSLIYFTQADTDFPDGTLFTVQTMSGLPPLPPGRELIGQAYRIVASPGAVLPDGSVSVQYLQNDLTVAGVADEDLELYFHNGSSWQVLDTRVDDYYNLASAPSLGAGVYALFASIRISLPVPGWNDISYLLRDPQSPADALASIAGQYSLVYGYDNAIADAPWQVYDPALPNRFRWVNTLAQLEFGKGYWLHTTTDTTLYFASPTVTTTTGTVMLPVTFYGQLNPVGNTHPSAGMTVTVLQGGVPLGSTLTWDQDGTIVYEILVYVGSGPVSLQAGAPFNRVIDAWSTTRTNRFDLPVDLYQVYSPLLSK